MTQQSTAAASGGPAVSIVIPTFNRLDLTRACLEGLRSTAPDAEIIVVDNGSTDGTREFLRAEQKARRLTCLLNEENIGFGKACNRAAALATGANVLLLNNDIVPKPGWLEALLRELDDPEVGIVGSRLLYPDGRIQHAGADFTAIGETEHVHRFAAGDDPAVTVTRDYPVVTGASLLVRGELWAALGGFDEGYWMYVEDVDLCIRAWQLGYRVRYAADSVLIHHESASSPDHDWRIAHLTQSWQRFHERWLGRMPAGVLATTARPEGIVRRTRFVVAARASELAANPSLLAAYAATFNGRDEVTLAILDVAPKNCVSPDLLAAVRAAGLDAEDGPDLMAVPGSTAVDDHLAACGADAVLSEQGLGAGFDRLPAFGAADSAGLHACAVQAARATLATLHRLGEQQTAAA